MAENVCLSAMWFFKNKHVLFQPNPNIFLENQGRADLFSWQKCTADVTHQVTNQSTVRRGSNHILLIQGLISQKQTLTGGSQEGKGRSQLRIQSLERWHRGQLQLWALNSLLCTDSKVTGFSHSHLHPLVKSHWGKETLGSFFQQQTKGSPSERSQSESILQEWGRWRTGRVCHHSRTGIPATPQRQHMAPGTQVSGSKAVCCFDFSPFPPGQEKPEATLLKYIFPSV